MHTFGCDLWKNNRKGNKNMYKEKIDAYIDSKQDEMLADLALLINIDSQKTEEKEGMPYGEGPAKALAAAEELMKKYGFLTKNYDNRVVTGDFSEAEKGLDVLAHLDVVPVTEDWTMTKPFEMKVIDGKIYGRGTSDDKGPAIAALYAMRAIKELGLPMKKSMRLILGSDEECGSTDLEYYYSVEKEAPYTFTPDAEFPLINIEKGRLPGGFAAEFSEAPVLPAVLSFNSGDKVNVVPQRAQAVVAGVEWAAAKEVAEAVTAKTGVKFEIEPQECSQTDALCLKISARGVASHAASPQEGKNALTATLMLLVNLPLADSTANNALKALEKLMPYEDTCGKNLGIYRNDPESGELTLSFSMIDFTTKGLRGAFDARLPIGCTDENTMQVLIRKFTENGITFADQHMKKPHCVPGDSEFVKTLLGSFERYTGIKGEPMAIGGGTYVHDLERGVAFGCAMPGEDTHMHGDDEYMNLDTLMKSTKIFADAILKICNELA